MRTLLAAALALGGCYSPELPDCVVACQAADECGEGQTCIGGLCRTQGATCEGAGSGSTTPPARVQLQVTIEHEGAVVVDGVGTCRSEEDRYTCSWSVRSGSEVVLEARPLGDDFDKWATANCADQDTTCSLVPTMPTIVIAKFK